jgi:ubiquitin carboxyl-terminal hydrolase 7
MSSTLMFLIQLSNCVTEEEFLEDAKKIIEENSRNEADLKIENEKNGDKENSAPQIEHQEINSKFYKPEDDFINIAYDLNFNISVVNTKIVNFQVKDLSGGKIIFKEIPLNTALYYKNDDIILVTEMTAKRIYNYDVEFTGIINEAMTCYMNSMLQTLNILGYFKQALFDIEEENIEDIAYCLQRFFYDLMTEKDAIKTNRLTKSFGWSQDEIFIQHDVQEFNMLLSDIMEKKMKGTKSEGAYKYLFEGKSLSYIRCLNVPYESSREECFIDIQLTVKDCEDIIQSLKHYTQEETLEGDDMYEAEGYGKQRAKIGKKISKLPNVMILQLKRFEYNPKRDKMEKINDHFKFYDKLDVKDFVHNPSDEEDYNYTLHSVVVHKGNIHNGHYYAYIRPSLDNKWYNFNDEMVRESDPYEVFNSNFGGFNKLYKHRHQGEISEHLNKSDGNAYILIYIKDTEREKILTQVSKVDVKY